MARFPITAAEAYLPADLRGDDAANVRDNLAASATPISVEPAVRKRRNMREEQIARLVSLGSTPEEAAMYVDRMIEVTGSDIDPELFDSYNTPENNESLRRSIAAGNASAARMKAFELDYNAATGHPEYGYDESGNPAKLGKVDIDKPSEAELWAKGARAYHHRAPYNSEMEARNYGPGSDYVSDTAGIEPDFVDSTVPGPRTLDGRSPTPSRGLNAEEAAAYNTRPANGLSKRDSDMRERGFVPVVTPNGVSYMLAGGKGDSGPIPGGVGRRGARPDLTESGKYEEVERVGPDGKSVVVLAPTKEFKEEQEANLRERRKALAEERNARRSRWQATAFLAGGSHNLNSGNRAIYNQASQIEDPVKRAEFLAQFRPTPGNYQSNDPRIQVAQIQAQAAKENAAAEREARNSQNQWQAQHQAGIEERAAAARLHDAAMQRQFDAEQRQLDREHAASQGNAAREEASVARQAELDQRRMEHEERMAAEERRYQLMREESAAREKAAEQRHAETLEGMRSEREGRAAAAGATVEAARIGAEARRGEASDERAEKARQRSEIERAQTLGGMAAKYGDGVNHIAAGNYETPEADAALRKIAEGSDQTWFWGGFLKADGERMNAALKLLGVPDPAIRRRLVEKYGFQMQSHGGRNDRGGYYFHGNPEY